MTGEQFAALFAAIALLALGCAREVPPDETAAKSPEQQEIPDDPEQRALAAKDALLERLSTRLMSAIADGGPVAAISVCKSEAPSIAKKVGKQYGLDIGRTSFRLRNQANAPPDWAKPLIEKRLEQPHFASLPDGRMAALLPIRLKAQCLTCHGPDDQIAEDVKAAIARQYPDDQATGFKVGDLRGWFWLEVPAAANGKDS